MNIDLIPTNPETEERKIVHNASSTALSVTKLREHVEAYDSIVFSLVFFKTYELSISKNVSL